jgi:hypothetical protein
MYEVRVAIPQRPVFVSVAPLHSAHRAAQLRDHALGLLRSADLLNLL